MRTRLEKLQSSAATVEDVDPIAPAAQQVCQTFASGFHVFHDQDSLGLVHGSSRVSTAKRRAKRQTKYVGQATIRGSQAFQRRNRPIRPGGPFAPSETES